MNEEVKDLSSSSYSPAITAAVRDKTVSDVVNAKLELFKKRPDRVEFDNLEAVRARAEEYISFCADNAMLPSLQGLAAHLGVSRIAVYKYLNGHSDTPTAQYLVRLRAFFTDCRITATDKGASHPVTTIFLLKNSSEGYADRVELAPVQPESPYQGVSEEVLKAKYLTDMAEDVE